MRILDAMAVMGGFRRRRRLNWSRPGSRRARDFSAVWLDSLRHGEIVTERLEDLFKCGGADGSAIDNDRAHKLSPSS